MEEFTISNPTMYWIINYYKWLFFFSFAVPFRSEHASKGLHWQWVFFHVFFIFFFSVSLSFDNIGQSEKNIQRKWYHGIFWPWNNPKQLKWNNCKRSNVGDGRWDRMWKMVKRQKQPNSITILMYAKWKRINI